MKILVPIKRVPDPDQKVRIADDQRNIDDSNVAFVMNTFDAIALEEALQICERSSEVTEVLAIGIGDDDYEEQLREALALGADRAVLVHCDQSLDSWNVARLLRAMVQRERPDLILMGKQAVDNDANQTGQFLAALLDWPQATFASKIEFVDGAVRVARETDVGIEVVVVSLPAVITADLRLNEPRYASLPSILKAKKKPLQRIVYKELEVTIESRMQVLRLEPTSTRRDCRFLEDVDDLVGRLRYEAKII